MHERRICISSGTGRPTLCGTYLTSCIWLTSGLRLTYIVITNVLAIFFYSHGSILTFVRDPLSRNLLNTMLIANDERRISIFVFASGLMVVVINLLAILFHFLRSNKARFGMLFMLLSTNVVYGIFIACSRFDRLLEMNDLVRDLKMFALLWLAPILAQQIVSISSSLLALDRVLLMTFPLNYQFMNISLRLSLATLVNSFLFSLCGLILYRKRSYTTKNYGLIEIDRKSQHNGSIDSNDIRRNSHNLLTHDICQREKGEQS
ncbi:hypothetical protein L596_008779 [Steinernema carpocapsae]|uniref:Uncharacterized protein n=1 Tax=Steinernema carpocapsae TaxID=34508 RepID=A0A4U5PEM3_STECR|nr:hypothetical protein L596_008779 [Steinernema carpocapsae]